MKIFLSENFGWTFFWVNFWVKNFWVIFFFLIFFLKIFVWNLFFEFFFFEFFEKSWGLKVSKRLHMNWGFQKAKRHLPQPPLPPLDQQHMLTSLAAGKKPLIIERKLHATGCRVTSRGTEQTTKTLPYVAFPYTTFSCNETFLLSFFQDHTDWMLAYSKVHIFTLSLMLLNIHLLTATRKSNYLARKEQEVLK